MSEWIKRQPKGFWWCQLAALVGLVLFAMFDHGELFSNVGLMVLITALIKEEFLV